MPNLCGGSEGSILAVAEGCQVIILMFRMLDFYLFIFFLMFDIFVAEYLGLKDEREGWLCAKNMWICW